MVVSLCEGVIIVDYNFNVQEKRMKRLLVVKLVDVVA